MEAMKAIYERALQEYIGIKKRHPTAVILVKIKDNYMVFNNDTDVANDVLGLPVIRHDDMRDKRNFPLRTSSFPFNELDTALPKLIRSGHRVAIYDGLAV